MPILTLYSKLSIKAEFILIKNKCYGIIGSYKQFKLCCLRPRTRMKQENSVKKSLCSFVFFIIQLFDFKKGIAFLKKKDFSTWWQDLLWVYRAFHERFRCMFLKAEENMRFKSKLNRRNASKFLQSPLVFYVKSLVKFTFLLLKPKFPTF